MKTFGDFDRFVFTYSQQSRILQSKTKTTDEAGSLPSSLHGVWGEKGVRDLLYTKSTNDLDQYGFKLGSLAIAKEELSAVWNHWQKLNAAQPFPAATPDLSFQEKIDKASAKVEVLKQEIAVLKEIVAEFDAKCATEQTRKMKRQIGKCVMYRIGGKQCMDGRLIEDGKFLDNGESVEEYRNYHMSLKGTRHQQIAS